MARARKPVRIDTPEAFTKAREALGLDKTLMALALRLPVPFGRETIRRYEDGSNARGIPGSVQLAMEAFASGWRPAGVKFPCDEGKG
jgi:hypothetical protein